MAKRTITIKEELKIDGLSAEEQVVKLEEALVAEREKSAGLEANLGNANEAIKDLEEMKSMAESNGTGVKTMKVGNKMLQVLPGKIRFKGKDWFQDDILKDKEVATELLEKGGDMVSLVKKEG